MLTDAQWAKMEPLCLGRPGGPGRSGKENRLFVEAVLWIVRTGSPWRDGPAVILVTKWPCALSMARPHSSVGVQFTWPSAGFLLPRLSPA